MKRIISLVAAVFILFSGSFSTNVLAEGESMHTDGTEFGFLSAINVLPEDFETVDYVKRGEFAYIVAKTLYSDFDYSSAFTEKPFSDVAENNIYYNEIKLLRDLNIILGDSALFYPNETISVTDAITILLKALGYQPRAEARGGYPSGYYYVANQTGLTKGLDSDTNLSAKNAVKLIYNCLFVNIIALDSIQNGQVYTRINSEETVLSAVLKISEYDGVLINNGISSPQNDGGFNGNTIVISDFFSQEETALNATDPNIHLLLGCRVKAFAKENSETGKMDVVYAGLSDQVTQMVLTDEQMISVTSTNVEYKTNRDGSSSKKLSFTPGRPLVFINGVNAPAYTTSQLRPANGFVTFIDNNGDNKTDVIKVTEFVHSILVDRISGEQIYCSKNASNSLDLSNADEVYYKIIKDGEIVGINDIAPQNVISVAKSGIVLGGKTLYELYVSETTVTGDVSEVTSDNELIINDVCYPASKEFLDINPNFMRMTAIGYSGTIRLNVLGQISFADKEIISDIPYAYLINITNGNGFGDEVLLKYYSLDGIFKTSVISSKVKIDGQGLDGKLINQTNAGDLFLEIQELLCVRPDGTIDIPIPSEYEFYEKTYTNINPRPAIIERNGNNEIISIDTDAPTYGGGAEVGDDGFILRAGKRVPRNERLWTTTFDGGFIITSDTVVIKVADIDRYGLKSGTFSHLNINAFEQDINDIYNYGIFKASPYLAAVKNYDIQVYNVDEQTGTVGLAVLRGDQLPITSSATTSIFLRLTDYYDPNRDQQCYKIYYYQLGEERSAVIELDYLHPWFYNLIFGGRHPSKISGAGTVDEIAQYEEVEPLRQGDIINVEKTGSYLTFVARELNVSRINQKIPSTTKPGSPGSPYSVSAYSATVVTIPFDERQQKYLAYNGYNLELGIPLKISGGNLCVRLMYNNTSTVSTIQDYLAGPVNYFDRYIPVRDIPVTVVEEVVCNDHDSCEFTVRMGDYSDIRFAQSDSAEDVNKASRIYYSNRRGLLTEMVVYNLKETHNQRKGV